MKASITFTTYSNSEIPLYSKGVLALHYSKDSLRDSLLPLYDAVSADYCLGDRVKLGERISKDLPSNSDYIPYDSSLDGKRIIVDLETGEASFLDDTVDYSHVLNH